MSIVLYCYAAVFYYDSIDLISFATEIDTSCPLATRSTVEIMLLSLAVRLAASPHTPGIKRTVPNATRTRDIASDSYLPLHRIASIKLKKPDIQEVDDEDEEYMYELVFNIAVASESLTFLLSEGTHGVIVSKILTASKKIELLTQ